MNALTTLKSFEAKHRLVPKSIAAASALSLAVMSAAGVSAEENSSTVDISTVTNSMTASLSDLASKVGVACAGVVGAGLTIFAMRWAVGKVMSFFKAIGR